MENYPLPTLSHVIELILSWDEKILNSSSQSLPVIGGLPSLIIYILTFYNNS